MQEFHIPQDRASMLAEIAEWYYLEGKDQAEIAKVVGVTRSMISRMLKEAREKGIVEIRINRVSQSHSGYEAALKARYNLMSAHVAVVPPLQQDNPLKYIGIAAEKVIKHYLVPGTTIGLAWGHSTSAAIDAMETHHQPIALQVVQLVGALGAVNAVFDGYGLVLRFTQKTGGTGYFLNAPCYCQSLETARSLMEIPAIRETIELGKRSQVALLGIGSTELKYSSFYHSEYIPDDEINHLLESGAVGNVIGIHFDRNGKIVCEEFGEHLIAVQKDDLLRIPVRIGIAGGPGKALPMLGALRGGLINVMITDDATAQKVLALDE